MSSLNAAIEWKIRAENAEKEIKHLKNIIFKLQNEIEKIKKEAHINKQKNDYQKR